MKIHAAGREFDLEKQRLILDLAFLTEDTIADIMKLVDEPGLLSFEVKLSKRTEEIEDIQRNIWFMYVSWVLRQQNAPVNRATVNSLSNDWKCVYLPASTITINGKEIPVPEASLARGKNEISPERMNFALARIKYDYSIPDKI
jgi:hypothetical protein